jgi:uncharacterized protein YeaO (DUF488 family)
VVRTKSVYAPIERSKDGLRLLVSRFRSRGLRRNRYDVWMPNLGPSEKLLRGIRLGNLTWAEFSRQYRAEILGEDRADTKNRLIKNHGQKFTLRLLNKLAARGPITLMCYCHENQAHCHRHLLKKLLRAKVLQAK